MFMARCGRRGAVGATGLRFAHRQAGGVEMSNGIGED